MATSSWSAGSNGAPRELPADQLEVAILDRQRPQRAFKRITGTALTDLLPSPAPSGVPADDASSDSAGTVEEVPIVPPPDPRPGQPPAMPRPDDTAPVDTTPADGAGDEQSESDPPSPGSA